MFNAPNHLSPFQIGGSTAPALSAQQPDGSYKPNFNTDGTFNNAFGQVTSTTDPRTMEFVLRVHF